MSGRIRPILLVLTLGRQTDVFQCGATGPDGFLDQVTDQRLQLGAGQGHRQMLGIRLIGGNERQIAAMSKIEMSKVPPPRS